MKTGFSEDEYSRVREWLVAALFIAPGPFDETEMLAKLRSNEWLLLTTDNAACVLQFCEIDGERIANILVIGGRIGGSLREIMNSHIAVCEALRKMGFAYIVGEPRKEWHAFLKKNGFEQKGKEFIKRLN